MREVSVPGFRPSRNGFHFANRWPATPALWLGRGYLHLGIGDAAAGLCGGMTFIVRDRFERREPIDLATVPPPAGSTLFREIVRRQVDSFDRLIGLPVRFWRLAALPPDRLARATAGREWPRIRSALDGGTLAMVGLVRSAGASPLHLGRNHQVLAWRYRVEPGALRIGIYDPNWPDRDDVELSLRVQRDVEGRRLIELGQSTGEPVFGFFLAPYLPRDR